MAKTKQLSFVVDENMVHLIDALKSELGVNTTSAVFRKALALTELAAKQAKESNHVVSIKGAGQAEDKAINILLSG